MPMSERIRIVLIKRKMTVTALAERIGISPQNLTNKLKRDNFTESELREIAAAIDCTFETAFALNDTGEKV